MGLSTISEFYTAIGQFFNYRTALEKLEDERLFPIPYSLFPIPYSLLPTPYSLLPSF